MARVHALVGSEQVQQGQRRAGERERQQAEDHPRGRVEVQQAEGCPHQVGGHRHAGADQHRGEGQHRRADQQAAQQGAPARGAEDAVQRVLDGEHQHQRDRRPKEAP